MILRVHRLRGLVNLFPCGGRLRDLPSAGMYWTFVVGIAKPGVVPMTMTNTAATATSTTMHTHTNRIVVDVAADNALATRLNHPRAEVAAALRVAIEKGGEIRDRRIRYQEDLDEARIAKLKWTAAALDLLNALFDNSSVADYCNDWVGKIFPEYAELGNFVEQFYEEMEYRLAKLRVVLERVEQVVEPMPAPAIAPEAAAPAEPVQAPAVAAPVVPVAPVAPVAPAARVAPAAAVKPSIAAPAPAPAVRAARPAAAPAVKAVVTHAMEPVSVPCVLLLGAPATDPAHAAAAELLKRLSVHAKPAQDPLAASATDAAVFIVPSESSDPAASRLALFQIGCAVGRLGTNRVCVLLAPGAAPCPETGLAHVAIDPTGGWQLQLARQLKQAGMDVDMNKLC